jgi:hypothetical protein
VKQGIRLVDKTDGKELEINFIRFSFSFEKIQANVCHDTGTGRIKGLHPVQRSDPDRNK